MHPEQLDTMIGMQEARKLMRGRMGKPPSLVGVRRWIKVGYRPRGSNLKEPIRLKAIRWGQDFLTTREWIKEFEDARWNLVQLIPPEAPKKATSRAARATNRQASKSLDRMGI